MMIPLLCNADQSILTGFYMLKRGGHHRNDQAFGQLFPVLGDVSPGLDLWH